NIEIIKSWQYIARRKNSILHLKNGSRLKEKFSATSSYFYSILNNSIMAPPVKNPLPDFNNFPNKIAYVKLVKNYCRGKGEDEAIDLICNAFPKMMIDSYFNRFLDDSFEGEMRMEELLEHIEEYVKEQELKDTLWDKANAAYSIRFPFGVQEACQKLLIDLYGRFRAMLKGMEKKDVQQVVVTRFLSLVPSKMGRELVEKFENPTYDETLKFAAERDKKYEVEKRQRKLSEESRSKDQDRNKKSFKDREKKSIPKGNQFKPSNRREEGNNKEWEEESQVKIAFFSKTNDEDVATAKVSVEGYGETLMYLDSCSSINLIPKTLAEKLVKVLRNIELKNVEPFAIKSIHETCSETRGAVELTISIPETAVQKEKVIFHIDEEASSPLLSKNFLKKFGINPVLYGENKKVNEFNGMEISQTSEKFLSLLKSMPTLYSNEKDYDKNKCTASFTVSESYYPVRKRVIPVPKDLDVHVRANIAKQVEKGWLEPIPEGTIVENVNSMVLVRKNNSEDPVRVCFNCTHLNRFLKVPEDMEELPSIKDLLHIDVEKISLFDIKSAFNRIDIEEECRQYLILGTPYGLFRSRVLVFGLKISPYIWMKTLKIVLKPVLEYVRIYYDDIVNIAKGELHDQVNCTIIQCLDQMNMQLTSHKCAIGVNKGIFLGYLIECPMKISIPKDRVEALLKLPCPKNSKEVMEMMGRFQYFASMIPDFAELTAPIHDYKSKKGEFQKDIIMHFEKLKKAVAKSISLEAIRKNCKGLVIFISVSDIAVCSLMQACYPKEARTFAVGGRKLRKSEKNYGKLEKVLLGVREIIAQNKYVAANFEITVYSEVQGLQKAWDSDLIVVSTTCQRLLNELKTYNLKFFYLKGSKNVSEFLLTSDYSSDYSKATVFLSRVEKDVDSLPVSVEEMKKEYFSDKNVLLIKTYIEEGSLPESKKLELSYSLRSKLDKVECRNGVIYLEKKLLIPFTLRHKFIDYFHRYHASFDQMSRNIKSNFIGESLIKLAKEKADSCQICLTFRRNSRKTISNWPETEEKRERFHSDCAEYGKHLFMVNCDAHTGYCAAVMIKGVSAKDIIGAYSETYQRMETPLIQVADNGKGFYALQTKEYLQDLGIVPLYSVPRCPESNGVAEKCVGLIKSYLDKQDNITGFKIALQKAVNAVNNRIVNGIMVKSKFFGHIDTNWVKEKYEFKSYPFVCNIKYKLDRNDRTWEDGKCLERIGKNLFRITDMEERKVYIRKSDSILFLDKGGRITSVEKIDNLIYQEKNESISLDEEFTYDEGDKEREYIKIGSEEEFKAFRKKRNEYRLFLATDGSTEKGKGFGGVIWGYIEQEIPEIYTFKGSKGLAASAQLLEVAALEEGLRKLESSKKDERFMGRLAVVTDSEYVGRSLSSYLLKWKRRGYITTKGARIQHEKQWRRIDRFLEGWEKVIVLKAAAHKGILINEAADIQSKLGAADSTSRSSTVGNIEEGDD
uniref:Ribonuclease H n=2 Tax=Strongyloides stercoralis TaxID=6248 RepID=A0AAF5DQ71_STRER